MLSLYATSKCLYKNYERYHKNNYLGLIILYAISHFADFEQVIIKISHFAVFKQVIIKIVILSGMPRQTASKLF